MRGNLFCFYCRVDCHESSLFKKSLDSRNDDNVNSFNDGNFSYAKNPCHTERSEVSFTLKTQTEIFRAYALNMTKKIPSLQTMILLLSL
ncbi:hypothetical protein [Helicobacter sp. T3_23-1056]